MYSGVKQVHFNYKKQRLSYSYSASTQLTRTVQSQQKQEVIWVFLAYSFMNTENPDILLFWCIVFCLQF